ncbi:hypothetical protein HN51_020137 [Arachis hypogaea]
MDGGCGKPTILSNAAMTGAMAATGRGSSNGGDPLPLFPSHSSSPTPLPPTPTPRTQFLSFLKVIPDLELHAAILINCFILYVLFLNIADSQLVSVNPII